MRLIGNFGYPRGIWRQMFDRISKRPSRSRSEDDDDSLTVPTKLVVIEEVPSMDQIVQKVSCAINNRQSKKRRASLAVSDTCIELTLCKEKRNILFAVLDRLVGCFNLPSHPRALALITKNQNGSYTFTCLMMNHKLTPLSGQRICETINHKQTLFISREMIPHQRQEIIATTPDTFSVCDVDSLGSEASCSSEVINGLKCSETKSVNKISFDALSITLSLSHIDLSASMCSLRSLNTPKQNISFIRFSKRKHDFSSSGISADSDDFVTVDSEGEVSDSRMVAESGSSMDSDEQSQLTESISYYSLDSDDSGMTESEPDTDSNDEFERHSQLFGFGDYKKNCDLHSNVGKAVSDIDVDLCSCASSNCCSSYHSIESDSNVCYDEDDENQGLTQSIQVAA